MRPAFKATPWYKKRWGIGGIIVGLILVAGVVFGDDGENATMDGPPTAASSSEPTPDATTDEPTEEATPTEGAIPEEVEPATYKGSGNKVLKINKPEEGIV